MGNSLTDALEIGVYGLARDRIENIKHLGKEGMYFLGHHDDGGDATALESGSSDGINMLMGTGERGQMRRLCSRRELAEVRWMGR